MSVLLVGLDNSLNFPSVCWKIPLDAVSCCFRACCDPLDEDAALVGRIRGRDGWSSTPALLYTRQREISAYEIENLKN